MRWKLCRIIAILLFVVLAACGGGGGGSPDTNTNNTNNNNTQQNATMTISVQVPSNTPSSDTIYLRTNVLFGVNEQETAMTKVSSSPDVWQASVTAPEGTVLRYRYSRNQDWDKEETYPLRSHVSGFHYREALMRNSGNVAETVAQWEDLALVSNATGTLSGMVTDQSGDPIMGIRVSAGPHQTTTRKDGSYRVYGVPAGQCEITFRADNGEYVPARAAATVSSTSTTTVNMQLNAAPMAPVVFNVAVPNDTPSGAMPRLFGDGFRLGMFPTTEGTAVETAGIIDMKLVSGQTWSYTAALGIGSCFNYTYTLGTNNINNERDAGGNAVIRSFCVNGPMTLTDTVAAWRAPGQVPVALTAASPTGTADTLYVTTDAFGGYAPMKMWSSGTNTAAYVIYSDPSTTINYRYVRNGDPAIGLEVIAPDQDPALFRTINSGSTGTARSDVITAWRHQMRETAQTNLSSTLTPTIISRPTASAFQTGVELIDYWRPAWQPLIVPTLDKIKSKNAEWVQIASVWGIINMDSPLVEEGWNSFTTEELVEHIQAAKTRGLKVALRAFPYPAGAAEENAFKLPHSDAWFDQFFDEVKAALLYHAQIAKQENVDMLILPNFNWAEDGGTHDNPTRRAYVNAKWKNIISAVRSVYSGKLTTTNHVERTEYDWYGDLDYLGDIWWVPLAATDADTVDVMYQAAKAKLTSYYLPIKNRFNKPFVFTEVAYYSANSSAVQTYSVTSTEIGDFVPANPSVSSDYDEQGMAYLASLSAFAETDWVQGAYSFGYAYFDFDSKGYSIRAKTAENIMSQIYQQINTAKIP